MRKIFTLVFSVMLMAQTAAAQQSVYIISNAGALSAYPASTVTFDNDVLNFSYEKVTEISKQSFASSFTVSIGSGKYKSLGQTPEVGICFSDVNDNPTVYNSKIEKGTALGNYTFSINGLDAGTTYYYRAYVKMNGAVCYGDVQKVTTLGTKSGTEYKVVNGHKFVDLGLPSGLLWATCNVGGAVAADQGRYFAWGETETKSEYSWNTYQLYTAAAFTKYNATDAKTVLDKEDDAANAYCGASFRMPTNAEFAELCNADNCTWTWTSQNTSSGSSISGYLITSKKNGNSIFIPAAGYRVGQYSHHSGSFGYYWSSTLDTDRNCQNAYNLFIGNNAQNVSSANRDVGYPIRPVAVTTTTKTEGVEQNMCMTDSNGCVNIASVPSIKYSTFTASDKWFTVTNSIDKLANNEISASYTIALAADADVMSIATTPEVGVCYAYGDATPTVSDLSKVVTEKSTVDVLGNHTFTLPLLTPGSTYSYRVYMKFADDIIYGDVVKATTLGDNPNDKEIGGHKFKNMGLPSGTLWAETNLGAESPADEGNFYAWGETETKEKYSSTNYKFGFSSYTKYNNTDNKTTLDVADDAAEASWNSGRIPSKTEWEELLSNCTWTWTTHTKSDGTAINGYEIVSNKNGNVMFLPAAGDGDKSLHGVQGNYWSRTRSADSQSLAWQITISSNTTKMNDLYRYYGYNVRPVCSSDIDVEDSNGGAKDGYTTTR